MSKLYACYSKNGYFAGDAPRWVLLEAASVADARRYLTQRFAIKWVRDVDCDAAALLSRSEKRAIVADTLGLDRDAIVLDA